MRVAFPSSCFALVVALGQFPLTAQAQDALDPVLVEREKEKGADVTSSGRRVELEDPPASGSASDALREIPSLQWFYSGGEGRRVSLSIRGVTNQQIQVSWQDVPLNTGLGGGVDLSQIPVWGGESIEIYEGGNGTFGSSALGGAIRIAHSPKRSPESSFQISSRMGTWGTRGARLQGQVEWKRWVASGGIEGHWQEGNFPFRDTNGTARVRAHNASQNRSWNSAVYSPTWGGHSGALHGWAHTSEREMPGVEQFPTPDARLTQSRRVTTGQWSYGGGMEHRTRTGLYAHQRSSRYRSTRSFLGGDIDNRLSSLAIGGHSSWQWQPLSWLSATTRVDGQNESADVHLSQVKNRHHRLQGGLASQIEWSLLRDRLLLSSAGRIEHTSGIGPIVLPKLGFLAEVIPGLTIRLNGSRSYRPPSFEELYFEQGNVRGNPDLGPEKAWSADLGIRLGDRANWLEVTYSRLWIDNLILFLPTSVFLIEATDSESVITSAVDVEAVLSLTRSLSWRNGLNHVNAIFADSGEAVPGRNPWQARTSLNWDQERWKGTVDLKWQSRLPLDRFGELEEEARWTLDTLWRWKMSSHLSVEVEGRNLFDKRDAVDNLLQPLPGRSYFVTTKVKI